MERKVPSLYSPHITWTNREQEFQNFRPMMQSYKVSRNFLPKRYKLRSASQLSQAKKEC
jgi:hypothetical protein